MDFIQKGLGLFITIALICFSLSVEASVKARTEPLKIAIVEAPIEHHAKRLRWLSSEKYPEDREIEKLLIDVRLRQAEDRARTLLSDAVKQKAASVLLSDEATSAQIDSLELFRRDDAIPFSVLKDFHQSTGADAILRFRITDYGQTPHRLLKWIYIGTAFWIGGVVTVAALSPKTRPYIGAYLLSEVVQEGTEAWLGTSLFSYEYKPVRIEAELIDTRNGTVLWADAVTKTASSQIMKSYPKEERGNRELQLAVATDRALEALLVSLNRKIGMS